MTLGWLSKQPAPDGGLQAIDTKQGHFRHGLVTNPPAEPPRDQNQGHHRYFLLLRFPQGLAELSCSLEFGKVGCTIPGDNERKRLFSARFKNREGGHIHFQQLSHKDHSQMETLMEQT